MMLDLPAVLGLGDHSAGKAGSEHDFSNCLIMMIMTLKGKLSRIHSHDFSGKALRMQILWDRLSDSGEMHM